MDDSSLVRAGRPPRKKRFDRPAAALTPADETPQSAATAMCAAQGDVVQEVGQPVTLTIPRPVRTHLLSSPESIRRSGEEYVRWCLSHRVRPTMHGYFLFTDCTPKRFAELEQDAELGAPCARVKSTILYYYEQCLTAVKNPAGAIFAMKAVGGWRDTQTIQVESRNADLVGTFDVNRLLARVYAANKQGAKMGAMRKNHGNAHGKSPRRVVVDGVVDAVASNVTE